MLVKVKFKPDEDRNSAAVTFEVIPKLAPPIPLRTRVSVAATKDGAVMSEITTKQLDFMEEQKKAEALAKKG